MRCLPPLATCTQRRIGAGGCMVATLEVDLTAVSAVATGYMSWGLEAVRAACASWAGSCGAAVVEAAYAAWVAGAGGRKEAGWGPLRRCANIESSDSKAASVSSMCRRSEVKVIEFLFNVRCVRCGGRPVFDGEVTQLSYGGQRSPVGVRPGRHRCRHHRRIWWRRQVNTQQPLVDVRRKRFPESCAVAQVRGRGRNSAGDS